MTRDEYVQAVNAVLGEHTAEAAGRLQGALALVPSQAAGVEIEIFVDQDGEGFLDVRVSLTGPDSFTLNRAIAQHAELFGTRTPETMLDPPLPLMTPGGESFSVHDALTDCAASWAVQVWRATGCTGVRVPVTVLSHDGYGATTPLELNPGG